MKCDNCAAICPTPAFSAMMGDESWECPFFTRPSELDLSRKLTNLWENIVDDYEISRMQRYV